MTSTVKIQAHCANGRELKITVIEYGGNVSKRVIRLRNGETYECVVYEHHSVAVDEIPEGEIDSE